MLGFIVKLFVLVRKVPWGVGVAELHACRYKWGRGCNVKVWFPECPLFGGKIRCKNTLGPCEDSVRCSEFGGGRFSEVANVLQVWDFQSVTRALSARGSVSASRSVRSGRFYCIDYAQCHPLINHYLIALSTTSIFPLTNSKHTDGVNRWLHVARMVWSKWKFNWSHVLPTNCIHCRVSEFSVNTLSLCNSCHSTAAVQRPEMLDKTQYMIIILIFVE